MTRPSRTRSTPSNINKGNDVFPENLTTKEAKLALAKRIMKSADKHNLSEPSSRQTPTQLSPPLGLKLDTKGVISEMNKRKVPQSSRRTTFRKPHPAAIGATHFDRVVTISNLGKPTAEYVTRPLNTREEESLGPSNLVFPEDYKGTPLASPIGSPLVSRSGTPLVLSLIHI